MRTVYYHYMQFLREDQSSAEQAIAQRICEGLLAGKRVLWLTSGGSNVTAQVAVMQSVRTHCGEQLGGLAIMPMDERYGKPGHADSNTQALREAGFDPGAATWIDVLMHDTSFDETVRFYNDVAATALGKAEIIVGQFGMGTDAHVAGVLPGSPATEPADTMVVGYEWQDYTRLTLTPTALKQCGTAYVLAYGDGKKLALERLQKHEEPLARVPAILLYDIPEVCVYNDVISNKG
jgi:6-phosphogluconolactonase/glucosamine-6-phosphate isomerase/deaminase